jgi:hypothetical protein
MRYWGNSNTNFHTWSAKDDAAEWTIAILLYGEGVQAGKEASSKFALGR